MDQKCCLYCKHFKIWDDDPCCLHKDGWKLVLPTYTCENYDLETFAPAIELNKESWEEVKKQFFNTYNIEYQYLIDGYLEMFPEDKDLINANVNGGA